MSRPPSAEALSGDGIWTAKIGPLGALYQGRSLNSGGETVVTYARPIGARYLSESFLNLKHLQYDSAFGYLTGQQGWAGTALRYAIDPTSGVWGSVTLGRSSATEQPYAYRAGEIALGYTKELRSRFNVETRLGANRITYDGEQPLFNVRRSDRLVRDDVQLTARNWSVYGFAPTLVTGFSRND